MAVLCLLVCRWQRGTTVEELNHAIRSESTHGPMHLQIEYGVSEDAVSSDYVGARHTSIVDSHATVVQGPSCYPCPVHHQRSVGCWAGGDSTLTLLMWMHARSPMLSLIKRVCGISLSWNRQPLQPVPVVRQRIWYVHQGIRVWCGAASTRPGARRVPYYIHHMLLVSELWAYAESFLCIAPLILTQATAARSSVSSREWLALNSEPSHHWHRPHRMPTKATTTLCARVS